MGTPEQDILSSWQSYLTNISSNLMELSDQTEYKIIKAGAADLKNGYTGITKELAQRCVDSVGTLWRYFALLSEVVDKAASLYSKKSFLYNSGEDIRELFEKTSVVIDSKHVDVKDRNILDDEKDEKKATPEELLQLMQQTFENTGQDIKKIANAQNESQRKGFEKLKQNAIKGFDEINVADAQALTSLTGYRKKLGMAGKWTPQMEEVYKKIKAGEPFSLESVNIIWQPLKPFVYTQVAKNSFVKTISKLKVPIQNKNSEYLLLMTAVLMEGNQKNNKLKAIHDFMEESGIDTIQFQSAVKSGE